MTKEPRYEIRKRDKRAAIDKNYGYPGLGTHGLIKRNEDGSYTAGWTTTGTEAECEKALMLLIAKECTGE